jgi:hypothetical protein
MQNFIVSPDFKTRVTDILNTKKFTSVFPYMNLINREGNTYNESELNQLVQFLGELPYSEVSELFNLIPVIVQKVEESSTETAAAPETAPEPSSPTPVKKSK